VVLKILKMERILDPMANDFIGLLEKHEVGEM
jgi:hypothetical protein